MSVAERPRATRPPRAPRRQLVEGLPAVLRDPVPERWLAGYALSSAASVGVFERYELAFGSWHSATAGLVARTAVDLWRQGEKGDPEGVATELTTQGRIAEVGGLAGIDALRAEWQAAYLGDGPTPQALAQDVEGRNRHRAKALALSAHERGGPFEAVAEAQAALEAWLDAGEESAASAKRRAAARASAPNRPALGAYLTGKPSEAAAGEAEVVEWVRPPGPGAGYSLPTVPEDDAIADVVPIRALLNDNKMSERQRHEEHGGAEWAPPTDAKRIDSGQGFWFSPADWANGKRGCLYHVATRQVGGEAIEVAVYDLSWAPQVLTAYAEHNAADAAQAVKYRVRVGDVDKVLSASKLTDERTWEVFPEATGTGNRRVREALANLVRDLGRGKVQYVGTPRWENGATLRLPSAETAGVLEKLALAGYGRVAKGAVREQQWEDACRLLIGTPSGRGALYIGAALGGLFLSQLDLEDVLDPLGFVVHSTGDGRMGKGSLQRATAAVLGNPANGPKGLLWSWRGTLVGLAELTGAVGVLPVVLSDTSAWRGSPAQLGNAIMGALEGPGPISGREGGVYARGAPYESVICSSGNRDLTSTLPGKPILARVVELPVPLTQSRAAAEELKRLTRRGHGWPLAQVLEGRITADQVRRYQQEASGRLSGDRDSTVEDLAVRCSVLVAGAHALGELIGLGVEMRDAALRAAEEALEAVAAMLTDAHRPLAETLWAAVWDAYGRRPNSFPDPSDSDREVGPRGREGFHLLPTERCNERLAVYPADLAAIAKEAGVDDPLPALRELRAGGHLVSKPGKLTGQFKRFGRWVGGVYIFEAPPVDDLDDEGGATGATWVSGSSDQGSSPLPPGALSGGDTGGPGSSDQGSSPSADQVAPVAPSPTRKTYMESSDAHTGQRPATESGGDEPTWPQLRDRLGTFPVEVVDAVLEGMGLLHLDPEQPSRTAHRVLVWHWLDVIAAGGWPDGVPLPPGSGAAVPEPEPGPDLAPTAATLAAPPPPPAAAPASRPGRRRHLDRAAVVGVDATGAVVVSPAGATSLGPRTTVLEIVEATAAAGAASAWLTRGALERLGMPATLPEREFGSGVDHEQVAALVAAGWEVVRPSKVPGLDHELVVRRDGLDVAVRVPAWPDSRGVVAWQPFAGVEGAEALAREVHVLQQGLSSGGRGWTLGTGALSTFRGAAAAHARVKQGGRLAVVDFERCETAPEGLVVPDLPNWWLAPAEWPDGGYAVLVDRHRDFLAALGSVLVPTGQLEPVEEGGLLVRAVVEGGSVPFVPSGEGWYPATLTALAEVDPEAFGRVEVLERLGTTGPVVRFFRGLTDALRAGLPAMPTGSPAYLALKGVYSTGISALGSAEYAKGTNAKWYRPDWKALHAGLHVANIWRSLVKARQAGAVLLGTGGRDGAVLWVPGRDDPVPGLKIGEGTGDWHVTATGRAGMVRRMVEGGAGIDAIKKELR